MFGDMLADAAMQLDENTGNESRRRRISVVWTLWKTVTGRSGRQPPAVRRESAGAALNMNGTGEPGKAGSMNSLRGPSFDGACLFFTPIVGDGENV